MADYSKSSSLEVRVTEEVLKTEMTEVQEKISEIDHKEENLKIDKEVVLIVEKKDT